MNILEEVPPATRPSTRLRKKIEIGDDGEAEHVLTLDSTWLRDHLVEVDGVLIDANNREQKASKTLKLDSEGDETLEISSVTGEVPAGQAIELTAKSSSRTPVTFAAFRLRSGPADFAANSQPWNLQSRNVPFSTIYYQNHYRPHHPFQSHEITRKFITLKPARLVKDPSGKGRGDFVHRGSLSLTRPGAYVVEAISHDRNGHELRSETVVVVHPRERTPGLYLALEKDRMGQGEKLRGSLQSRWTAARVCLSCATALACVPCIRSR